MSDPTAPASATAVIEELQARIDDPQGRPEDLAGFLDARTHAERVAAIRSLGRAHQRKLYARVDGFLPVRLSELVPADRPALAQVRHYGKNTLPLFTEFEKRFCRLPDTDPEKPDRLAGYNFQTLSFVTGPGYYVAVEDEARREVLVDYRQVPEIHPDGWPEIKRNEVGLSRFVYGFMVDTLRRVSQHVTVGSAARKGKDIGSWFMLCQEP